MKTIVISGARSNVGKTTLAEKISGFLPGSVRIKLGHGELKEDVDNVFYHAGTPYDRIKEENPGADFLVIESNRVLVELDPDLAIYIPADDPKPSAALAESRADIVTGRGTMDETAVMIAEKLGIEAAVAEDVAGLVCGGGRK